VPVITRTLASLSRISTSGLSSSQNSGKHRLIIVNACLAG
jgi:hypothetical protein